jgi:hypothetical protein
MTPPEFVLLALLIIFNGIILPFQINEAQGYFESKTYISFSFSLALAIFNLAGMLAGSFVLLDFIWSCVTYGDKGFT